jgi:hypothetical protein
MDIKRIFFITSSFLFLMLPVLIGSLYTPLLASIFTSFLFSFLFYILFHMLGITYFILIKPEVFDIFDYCFPFFGILLLNQKRIYYSDLGYFYLSGTKTLTIWEQNFFYSKKLGYIWYNGDVDKLRTEIKSKLDTIYEKELEELKKKKSLKDWNGYIDKKSERDDKLNKILK